MMKWANKTEYAVLLGSDRHDAAPFTGHGATLSLGPVTGLGSDTLLGLTRRGGPLSLCFSPRSIYSDVGEFSCVSREATTAHIRSTVDKIGLFKEEYSIAFTKVQDIDQIKARYSYLAIPASDLNKADLIDEDEALVRVVCPIEASLAAAVSSMDRNMVVIVYEDERFIRIIAAKEGVIYYLITINAAESFDALADALSGIREMTSLLANSYQEKVTTVYVIGKGEVSLSDLAGHGIATERFDTGKDSPAEARDVVLLGTARRPRYDFTNEKLRRTRRVVGYAKISMAVSACMALLAVVLFVMGWSSSNAADTLQKQINGAQFRNAQELKTLERDYASLSKNLDLASINALVDAYKAFQAEPKLHSIVDTISRGVPEGVYITRVEVMRPQGPKDAPEPRVEQAEGTDQRTIQSGPMGVVIQGVISTPYPTSKEVFSALIGSTQRAFKVNSAAYSHKEFFAEFSLNCEMKP